MQQFKVFTVSKTITLHQHHTFWYSISLPSLYANCYVKFANFTFEGGRKQTAANFSFSFYTWNLAIRIRLQEYFL